MLKPQIAIAAAILALSGCAAIRGQTAADSEQILTEAGFARQAPSAAQGTTGATVVPLPARQLTKVNDGGNVAYEFYDPQFCHCVYVGDAKQYAELQRLRSARVAEHEKLLRTSSAGIADPDPGIWGPWKPKGLDVK